MQLGRTLSDRLRSERFLRRRGINGVTRYRKVQEGKILKVCGGFRSWAATNDLEKETALEPWGQQQPEKKQTGRKQLEAVGEDWLSTWAGSDGKRECESYLKTGISFRIKKLEHVYNLRRLPEERKQLQMQRGEGSRGGVGGEGGPWRKQEDALDSARP